MCGNIILEKACGCCCCRRLSSYLIMSQPSVCESQAHCPANLFELCVALDERLQRKEMKNKKRAPQIKRDLSSNKRHWDVTSVVTVVVNGINTSLEL